MHPRVLPGHTVLLSCLLSGSEPRSVTLHIWGRQCHFPPQLALLPFMHACLRVSLWATLSEARSCHAQGLFHEPFLPAVFALPSFHPSPFKEQKSAPDGVGGSFPEALDLGLLLPLLAEGPLPALHRVISTKGHVNEFILASV